jgi:hypothetical protein
MAATQSTGTGRTLPAECVLPDACSLERKDLWHEPSGALNARLR